MLQRAVQAIIQIIRVSAVYRTCTSPNTLIAVTIESQVGWPCPLLDAGCIFLKAIPTYEKLFLASVLYLSTVF